MTATETIDSLFGSPAPEGNGQPIDGSLTALARSYLDLREAADRCRETLKFAEQRRDAAERDLLTAMKASNLKSLALDGGPKLTAAVRHVFQLPTKADSYDRAAALKWLRRVGGKDLIEASIHHHSLNAFCRERLERGLAVNPLIVDTELVSIQVRKD